MLVKPNGQGETDAVIRQFRSKQTQHALDEVRARNPAQLATKAKEQTAQLACICLMSCRNIPKIIIVIPTTTDIFIFMLFVNISSLSLNIQTGSSPKAYTPGSLWFQLDVFVGFQWLPNMLIGRPKVSL